MICAENMLLNGEFMDWNFKKIEANDIGVLTPYFGLRSNLTCDSVFLDSFLWKDYYQVEYCIRDGKAVEWKMQMDGEVFSAMPLCKEEDLEYYFNDSKKYFNEVLGQKFSIYLADELSLKILNLDSEKYIIEEQVDAADYLYDAEALRKLAGKKYHKKKNHVNAFLKEYDGRYEYQPLCCSSKGEILEFLNRWRDIKGEDADSDSLDYEAEGIQNIMDNCSELRTRMGGVYIDGQLEAFTIGSYNAVDKMAIIHIEKANPAIRGLYPFINQQFLIHEFEDAVIVNREDDVGLESLRKAKMSYHPIGFAKKFLVREK